MLQRSEWKAGRVWNGKHIAFQRKLRQKEEKANTVIIRESWTIFYTHIFRRFARFLVYAKEMRAKLLKSRFKGKSNCFQENRSRIFRRTGAEDTPERAVVSRDADTSLIAGSPCMPRWRAIGRRVLSALGEEPMIQGYVVDALRN